ncbi:MAG: transposase, partial [Epulopiscium sp.]|nr:transposase [Candidatus Epulonipiscium sp.]
TFDPEYCKSLLHKSLYKKADEVIQSIIGYELRVDQSVKMKVCRKHLDKAISQLAKPYQDLIDISVTLPSITEWLLSIIGIFYSTDSKP